MCVCLVCHCQELVSRKLSLVPGAEEVTMVTWEELEQAITDGWRASQAGSETLMGFSKRRGFTSLTSPDGTLSGASTKQPSIDQVLDSAGGLGPDQTASGSGGATHPSEGVISREQSRGPSGTGRQQQPRARDEAGMPRLHQSSVLQFKPDSDRRRSREKLTSTLPRRDERDARPGPVQQDLTSAREQPSRVPASQSQVHLRSDRRGLEPTGMDQPGLVHAGTYLHGVVPLSMGQLRVPPPEMDDQEWGRLVMDEQRMLPPSVPGRDQQGLELPSTDQHGLVSVGAYQHGMVLPGIDQRSMEPLGMDQRGFIISGMGQQGLVAPGVDQQGLILPVIDQHGLILPFTDQHGLVSPGLMPISADQQGFVQPSLEATGFIQPGTEQHDLIQSGRFQHAVVQPGAYQPGLVQPGADQRGLVRPGMDQSGLAQPGRDQHRLIQPGTGQHDLVQSGTGQGGLVQPGVDQLGMVQPGADLHGLVQPGMDQSGLAQPGRDQHGLVQSGTGQGGLVQPGVDQPGMIQPGADQHGLVQIGAYPPGLVQPGMDQHGLIQSGAFPSGWIQPDVYLPGLVQPGTYPHGLVQAGADPRSLVQPGIDQRGLVQLGADQYGFVQPGIDQLGLVQRGADQQGLVQSGAVQYGVVQPGMDQHGLAQPGALQSSLGQPGAVQHGFVQPGVDQRGLVQPGAVQPGLVQPGVDQRGLVQPGEVQRGLVQPGEVQHGLVQPGADQRGLVQPGADQRGLVQPGVDQRGLVQPSEVQRGLVQPGAVQYTLMQPGAVQRSLVQPGAVQRGLVQPGVDQRGLVQPGVDQRGLVPPGAVQRGLVQPGVDQRGLVPPGAVQRGLVQPGVDQRGLVQPGVDQRGLVQPGVDQRGLVQPGAGQPGLVQPGAGQLGMVQPGIDQQGLVQPQADPRGLVQPGAYPLGFVQPGVYLHDLSQPGTYPHGLVQPGMERYGLRQSGTYQPGLTAPGTKLRGSSTFQADSTGFVSARPYQHGMVPPGREQYGQMSPLLASQGLASPGINQRSLVPPETYQQGLMHPGTDQHGPIPLSTGLGSTHPDQQHLASLDPGKHEQVHPDAAQHGCAFSLSLSPDSMCPGYGGPGYLSADQHGQEGLDPNRTRASDQPGIPAQKAPGQDVTLFRSPDSLHRVSSERSEVSSEVLSERHDSLYRMSSSFPTAVETFRLLGELSGLYMGLKESMKDLDEEQAGQTDMEKIQFLLAQMGGKAAKDPGGGRDSRSREGTESWRAEITAGCPQSLVAHHRVTVADIEKELAELRESQDRGKAAMENSVSEASLYLQDQLDKLRMIIESMLTSSSTLLSMSMAPHKAHTLAPGQIDPEATCPACSLDVGHQVSMLVQRYEQLQDMVNSLVISRPSKKAKLQRQDEELLGRVQSAILQVQGDCEKLNITTSNLIEDHRQKQKDIAVSGRRVAGMGPGLSVVPQPRSCWLFFPLFTWPPQMLYQGLEKLEKEKANREHLEMEIDVKADKSALATKVSRIQFDATTEQLNHMMQELVAKMSGQEQDWQKMLDKLLTEMDNKLDRLELDPVKQLLEDRWKSLRQQLRERPPLYQADEAAAMRRQLLAHFHCLSCDRPLETPVTGHAIPVTPAGPGLPGHHSIRPYTVFELEQVRQHSRNLKLGSAFPRGDLAQMKQSVGRLRSMHSKMLMNIEKVQIHFGGSTKASSQIIRELLHSQCLGSPCYKRVTDMADYTYSTVPRRCGGSHTLTYPYHRSRPQHLPRGVYPTEEIQIAMKRDEVDILGLDGHIYKGRMDTRLPGILSKDSSGTSKRKSQQPRPHVHRPPSLGGNGHLPSRPQSAQMSAGNISVSSRQQKDRPSSEGRLSQPNTAHPPSSATVANRGLERHMDMPPGEGLEEPTRGPRSSTAQ
ncbi:PREDICTED: glutamine-rich protein 2 isoform X2 [Cercocebus atys]|uniref:glutamine-rich protein 2 isoform X2 n=1 Tax=Cercocebus atys TaxID=9531 RepID=UPI0005F52379|nr:PREDICTED: glutamine-rich protein 2 isoform X2 [Cercocebus atys]